MLKTLHYRLYPTNMQDRIVRQHLEECRWLWNTLLAERQQAWEERHESIGYYDQQNTLPALKASVRPTLAHVHSLVVQDVVRRLHKAFEAFFRRLKDGEAPGYPRFRGPGRYDSLTYSQWGNGVRLSANGTRLLLSKIGDVKIILHRPLEGISKTATIRRMPTGKWFVSIAYEWEPTPLPPTGQDVGIEVGLKTFATSSDGGQEIANPRFFRQEEHALAKAQRNHQVALDAHTAQRAELTQQVQTTHPDWDEQAVWQEVSRDPAEQAAWKERQRRRKVVARTHERARWKREDFAHQHSRRTVNAWDLIAIEDLNIRNLVRNPHLAKSIHDVAWGHFAALLRVKAEWAGRAFIAVDPAHTSQDCSRCGHRKTDLTLADRIYHCDACGLEINRDLNAALDMLARGRACLGRRP
jgi:putative transposase